MPSAMLGLRLMKGKLNRLTFEVASLCDKFHHDIYWDIHNAKNEPETACPGTYATINADDVTCYT